MKKAILSILIALSAFCFQSCLFEQEDIFEEKSSNRLAAVISETQKALVSSQYGWVFEMYTGEDLYYGGYAFTVKFDDEQQVEAMTEIFGDLVPIKSYYSVTDSNGPIISFDTYNDYLHFLATPSSGRYQACYGEFQFIVLDIKDDLITVKGCKTGNVMYLRKLDRPAEEYISDVLAMNDNLLMSELKGQVGSSSVNCVLDYSDRSIVIKVDGQDPVTTAFVITDKGLRLYAPVSVGKEEISSLTLAADGRSFSCDGIASSKLDAVFAPGYQPYDYYLGEFVFNYFTGTTCDIPATATVTLEEKVKGSTYTMKGLNPSIEFEIKYVRSTGTVNFPTQITDYTYNGNPVHLLYSNYPSGNLYKITAEYEMVGYYVGDDENGKPVYSWASQVSGYQSMALYVVTSSFSSLNVSSAYFTGSEVAGKTGSFRTKLINMTKSTFYKK